MKKFFSLVAAVLFAGSMFAATESVDFTDQGYTNQQAVASYEGTAFSVTFDKGSNSNAPKYYTSGTALRCYGGNTITVSSNNADDLLKVTFTFGSGEGTNAITSDVGDYENGVWTGAAKTVVFTIGGTSGHRRLAGLEVETGSSSVPAITAKNIDFGNQIISTEEDEFVLDTTLEVSGTNLSSAILAAGSEHVTVNGTLTAEGGTLNLHIVAAAGDFSEVITLTSGETVKEVTVSGKVTQVVVAPGIPAEMTANGDTKSYEASVNGVAGVKAGTSSADGSFTVTVPAGAIKLNFFAVAWNNAAGDIAISAPEGVTLSIEAVEVEKLDLLADAGISGSSNDYILQNLDPADCLFSIDLDGVEAATDITFASGTARRFVIWGAAYELPDPTAIDNTNAELNAVKVLRDGQLLIIKGEKTYNAQGVVVK